MDVNRVQIGSNDTYFCMFVVEKRVLLKKVVNSVGGTVGSVKGFCFGDVAFGHSEEPTGLPVQSV